LEVVGADVRLFTACGLGDVLSDDHPGI
ncbi:MAG: hypothetical protein QOG99_970, partial [Frankiales bacterium]|nr:hypothetical protein [Frankiales bacterium]